MSPPFYYSARKLPLEASRSQGSANQFQELPPEPLLWTKIEFDDANGHQILYSNTVSANCRENL